ncbi:hypothetical protein GCM10010275_41170 [Streptomyces litmocidini]|uniref:DUF6328 family protein n=1 Tax=Streptomyces litmocidini TaxID=67318 RepID=UPI00167CE3B6|nr:DUF6328 family protein [Streptomyces litmocidini]GGU98417.1 hypothetical protein GCM10010275_41170 [Streptomyces litmocidini]
MAVTRRLTEAEWRAVEAEAALRPRAPRPPEGTGERLDGQPEGARERGDGRWQEVLRETRVARTGVRILSGLLFGLAFTAGFRDLDGFDRGPYVVTVVLAASSTAALIAPVSLHRCPSGLRLKEEAASAAGRLVVCGTVLLALTVACVLLLILNVVLGGAPTAGVAVGAVTLWFALGRYATPYRLRPGAPARNQDGGRR